MQTNLDPHAGLKNEQEENAREFRGDEGGGDPYMQQGYGAQPYEPRPPRNESYKRPWYNQGWVWLIAAVFGIGAMLSVLLLMTVEIGGVREAVQEQTSVLREQNGLLGTIQHEIAQAAAALGSILYEIKNAVADMLAAR